MFRDRREAGKRLAKRLEHLKDQRPVVLALPRGGVPVAYEVARALEAELDVLVVRKLGVPGQPEFAMGAIASGGVEVLDEGLVRALRISPEQIETVVRSERVELERRERLYRHGRPPLRVQGRTVLVVDDGLATGASMKAALRVLRAQEAAHVVVAVPVAPPDTVYALDGLANDVVCVYTPSAFRAVGSHYRHFEQIGDEEVRESLEAVHAEKVDGNGP